MLWRVLQCPIRGSWYTCLVLDGAVIVQMLNPAVAMQELLWLCPGCLHTLPVIKASDCAMPGPSLGPLHCWFLERQCEIKAWKRSARTHGRSSSYTGKLAELPPSGHRQDWAVQVPTTSYLHMVWPGWQAAGYHWWRGSPEQATAARHGVARPMQPRRSWQSNVVACIPCSQPWSPQDTNQDSWHRCRGVGCVSGQGTATRRWTVASIWHREEFRYLAAHEIAAGPGPEKAQALPMFHALTGCDTASSFAGHGRKTTWTIWTVLPELTNAPSGIPDDVMHTIERFVILLYDRTSTCKEINKARTKIFAKNNMQLIPPTKAALEEHVKRAAYQGGHVWGQTLLPTPELPPSSRWSWDDNEKGCTSHTGRSYPNQPTAAMS